MKLWVLCLLLQFKVFANGLVETVEFINNHCVSEIAERLNELKSEEDWQKFVTESLPKASVYLSRRGRIVGTFGKDTSTWLPKGWEKPFLFGIHQGGQVFENQAASFFSRLVLWGDFLATEGRMQPVYTRRTQAVYLWIRLDHVTVFCLFQAKDLAPISWWQSHYSASIPEDSGSFGTWLFYYYFVGLILFCILLPFLGWVRVRVRFRLRLAVTLFLVLILSLVLASVFTDILIRERSQTLKYEYIAQKQRQVFEYEAGYQDFLNQYSDKLAKDFRTLRAPASMYEGGYFAAGNSSGVILESDSVALIQLSALFCKMYPHFLSHNQPDEELLKKLEPCRDKSTIVKFTTDRGMKSMVRGLVSGSEERFRVSNMQSSGLAIWHKVSEVEGQKTVIMVVHPAAELQKIYWDQLLDQGQSDLVSIADLVSAALYQKKKLDKSISPRILLKDPGPDPGLLPRGNGYLYQIRGTQYPATVFSFFVDKNSLFLPLKIVVQNFNIIVLAAFLIGVAGLILFVSGFQKNLSKLSILLQKAVRQEPIQFQNQRGTDELSLLNQDLEVMLSELETAKNAMPFVATDILELFTDKDGRLVDQIEDKACVLFSDIRSFTSISENFSAEEIVDMLNQYFTIWEAEVRKRGGVIEKFIGDAVVVLFFASRDSNYIQNAVETAMSMRKKVDEMNLLRQKQGKFTIRNGMGIAASELKFSVIGNQKKRHFYSDSPAMSEAEELEALTKFGKYTQIYASESVVYALLSAYDWHLVEDKVGIYELQ